MITSSGPRYAVKVKTAISPPDELLDTTERAAERLGLSRSKLHRRALQAFLPKHDDKPITETINEVYANIEGGKLLDPVLQKMQSAKDAVRVCAVRTSAKEPAAQGVVMKRGERW